MVFISQSLKAVLSIKCFGALIFKCFGFVKGEHFNVFRDVLFNTMVNYII